MWASVSLFVKFGVRMTVKCPLSFLGFSCLFYVWFACFLICDHPLQQLLYQGHARCCGKVKEKKVKGGERVTFYFSSVLRHSDLTFLWCKGGILRIFPPFLKYPVDQKLKWFYGFKKINSLWEKVKISPLFCGPGKMNTPGNFQKSV